MRRRCSPVAAILHALRASIQDHLERRVNPVQYLILDKSLGMSTGKAAAQAAHAAVEGIRLNAKTEWGNPWDAGIVNRWYQGGHYGKIVLESYDLHTAVAYIEARGIPCTLIIDEARTELEGLTPTAIGCPVVDKDQPHVRETFSAFKLYNDRPRLETPSLSRWDRTFGRRRKGNAKR